MLSHQAAQGCASPWHRTELRNALRCVVRQHTSLQLNAVIHYPMHGTAFGSDWPKCIHPVHAGEQGGQSSWSLAGAAPVAGFRFGAGPQQQQQQGQGSQLAGGPIFGGGGGSNQNDMEM